MNFLSDIILLSLFPITMIIIYHIFVSILLFHKQILPTIEQLNKYCLHLILVIEKVVNYMDISFIVKHDKYFRIL